MGGKEIYFQLKRKKKIKNACYFCRGPELVISIHIRRVTISCNSSSRASISLIWALGSLFSCICVHARVHMWSHTHAHTHLEIKQILSFPKANHFGEFWPKLGISSRRFYVPQMCIFLDCSGLWKAWIHLTECNLIFKLNYFFSFYPKSNISFRTCYILCICEYKFSANRF